VRVHFRLGSFGCGVCVFMLLKIQFISLVLVMCIISTTDFKLLPGTTMHLAVSTVLLQLRNR